jgi:hypothetical protein
LFAYFDLLIANCFHYDKELEVQWRKFSYHPAVEWGVRESVERHLAESKQNVLISDSDFSIEKSYQQFFAAQL